MKKDDIVLIPFPFTDLTGVKNRPAVILIAGNTDVTVSFITTQVKWQEQLDVLLEPSKKNGLKKTSLIRLGKLATIDTDLLIGRLGSLDPKQLEKLNMNLKSLLQLE